MIYASVKTHDGIFHADDVMACGVLSTVHDNCISFTRKRATIDDGLSVAGFDYVVDTGGRYDGQRFYDHHQTDFDRTHANGVPMSAFGLIWEKFGMDVIRRVLHLNNPERFWKVSQLVEIRDAVLPFVQWQDAHDNGKLHNTPAKFSDDRTVVFDQLTFQNIISLMNPVAGLEDHLTGETEMLRRFDEAVKFGQMVLERHILRKAGRIYSWEYVEGCDEGRSVLELPKFVEWNSPVSELAHIIYVIHPGMSENSWVVSAAKRGGGYSTAENLRKPFPQEWAGLQGSALAAVTKVPESVFCHKGRHLVTTTSLESARQIAALALVAK